MRLDDLKKANELVAQRELIVKHSTPGIYLGSLESEEHEGDTFYDSQLPEAIVNEALIEMKVVLDRVVRRHLDAIDEQIRNL